MAGEYLPPVVVRLTADIDKFLKKIGEAKAAIRDLGGDQTLRLKVKRDFDNLGQIAGQSFTQKFDGAKRGDAASKAFGKNFNIWRWAGTSGVNNARFRKYIEDQAKWTGAAFERIGGRSMSQAGGDAGKSWTTGFRGALNRLIPNAINDAFSNFGKGFKNTKTGRNGGFWKDLANNFQRLWGGISGMFKNASGTGGAAGAVGVAGLGGGVALTGVAAMIGTLSAVVSALGGGLTAATLGLGALGAVAMPTLSGLQSALTAVKTATDNYAQASANLNTAIHKSPADWKAYQATIHGLEPDLQNAAKLLTNQDATWQNLSPSMRKSLTALRNNAAAYKGLLPDQQKALNALLAQRDAWNSLSPAQQKAAVALQKVGAAWTKVTDAMQPIVLSLVVKGANVLKDLIPFVKPLATAGAGALGTLFTQLDKFSKSKGFAAFMKQMSQIAGPAIITLGHGLGAILIALGKFFTVLGKKDTIMMFNGTIRVLVDTITGLIIALGFLARVAQANARMMGHVAHDIGAAWGIVRHDTAVAFDAIRHKIAATFDWLRHAQAAAFHDVAHSWDMIKSAIASAGAWIVGSIIKTGHSIESNWNHAWTVVVNYVKGVPGAILRALGNLGSLLYNAGRAVIGGFLNGIKSAWGGVSGFLSSVGGWISHLKGPLDYDRTLLVPHGKAIMNGLMAGMVSRMPALRGFLRSVTSAIAGGGSGAPAWSHGSHPFIAAPAPRAPNYNSGQYYGGAMVVESHVYLDSKEIFAGVQKQAVRRQRRTGNNGLQRMVR